MHQEGTYVVDLFRDGSHGMKPVAAIAGETMNIIVEFDFARENITPDWSLTAYGAKGALTVRHN